MKQSSQLYEPATARQRLLISRLCMKLKIKEPLEERVMTQAEAGRLIRELLWKIAKAQREFPSKEKLKKLVLED